MNETRAIVEAFDRARTAGERCALATVVSVEGSAYRRPGARMLVTASGASAGTISAGCLEADAIEHARRAVETGACALVGYNTAATSDETAWSLGLGCDGAVRVFVEPLDDGSPYLAALRRLLATDSDLAVATVFRCPAATGVRTGARLVIGYGGQVASDIADGVLARMIERDARERLRARASGVRLYDADGGAVEVFVETIAPPPALVVFGAGHDALPIVELANGLGWRTEIVDPRCRPASRERFAAAFRVTLAAPEEFVACVRVAPRALSLVMTHDYAHDRAALAFLLRTPADYIGCMGPRKRTEHLLAELKAAIGERGGRTGDDAARLYAPVGLDIGADTPQEIALAIVAEMRAHLAGRAGGSLRRRDAPIHDAPIHDARPSVPSPESNLAPA